MSNNWKSFLVVHFGEPLEAAAVKQHKFFAIFSGGSSDEEGGGTPIPNLGSLGYYFGQFSIKNEKDEKTWTA